MSSPAETGDARAAHPGLSWNWSDALFGAVIALPALIASIGDVPRGLAFAVGVLPAAATGIAPRRRMRVTTVVVGSLAGASILSGSLLAHVPWLAVVALFGLGVGTALAAERSPTGRLTMVLALPLVAVGLSYTETSEAVGLAVIMALGSVWAFIVSLAWPERPRPPASTTPSPPMLDYGIRLGLAAASAAAIGFLLDLDHVGWPCAAALLVMRPATEMVELRAVGRVASVAIGATLAGVVANLSPTPEWYGLAVILAISGAAATHRSRWYVTSLFSTFLAISLLVYSMPSTADSRWLERMAETIVGVTIAYLFGAALPRVKARR